MTEAERIIRLHAAMSQTQLMADLLTHFEEITELAVQRVNTVGEAEYGDASFHKTPAALRRELFEEYADALFYACLRRHVLTE